MASKKYFIVPLALLLLSVPSFSRADTVMQQQAVLLPTKASLLAQLAQIQSEVSSSTPGTTTFSLSPGQSIQEATSSLSDGLLTITLPSFLHTTPDPTIPTTIPQPITQYAKITLEFDPCVAAAPTVCVSQASSSYPVMTSILKEGQDTGYLHYLITLTSLSSTTADFTITDSSFFTTIQSELHTIATQARALVANQ